MTDQQYKTLPDGSIDYLYYTARGRRIRSEAAHKLFSRIGSALVSFVALMLIRTASRGNQTEAAPGAGAVAGGKPEFSVQRAS